MIDSSVLTMNVGEHIAPKGEIETKFSIMAPILSLIFMVFGTGFVMTIVTTSMAHSGFNDFYIGIVHTAFYVGFLISSLTIERVIRQVGQVRALSAFLALLIATTILQSLGSYFYLWLFTRFVAGYCIAAFYVCIESWILAASIRKSRGKYLALYTASLYLSQSFSNMFLSQMASNVSKGLLVSCVFVALSIIPVTLSTKPSPQVSFHGSFDIKKFMKASKFGSFTCFTSGVILSSIYSFLPDFGSDLSISPSILMAITILGGALLQWPIGKLSDSFDRRKVLFLIVITSVLPATFLLFTHSDHVIYFWSFLMGGLLFCLYPVSVSLVCDCVDSEDLLPASGFLLFIYGVGSVIGPLITPFFTQFVPLGLVVLILILLGFLSVVGYLSIKSYRPMIPDEQMDFVSIPRTPVPWELDPRMSDR